MHEEVGADRNVNRIESMKKIESILEMRNQKLTIDLEDFDGNDDGGRKRRRQ